jgi:predicted metal-dependent hydrolase
MTEIQPVARPRYSAEPLPPYSYVPGHAPHPVSDPRGHMHGHVARSPELLEPERWQASTEYRYGVDLFNHGYYWEAHEAWESLWHTAGRKGPVAVWLKALIKLAAAAVKVREGNAAGAARHALRSLQLLRELNVASPFCGVAKEDLEGIADDIVAEAQAGPVAAAPTRVLDHWIQLTI